MEKKTVETDYETATVFIDNELEDASFERHYDELDHEYDGHMSGLLTTKGFSLKYDDNFGCIRNVLIITNIRNEGPPFGPPGNIGVVSVPLCENEQMPDCEPF